jgi:acyl-CoA thioester hydrolase
MNGQIFLYKTWIRLRWGDMDSMGHINNVQYFRYMEQARVEWLASLGYAVGLGGGEDGQVIADASCVFRVALKYPADIEVVVNGEKPGRSSLKMLYQLKMKDTNQVVADGASTLVWISPETGRSKNLPDSIRQLFSALDSGGDNAIPH